MWPQQGFGWDGHGNQVTCVEGFSQIWLDIHWIFGFWPMTRGVPVLLPEEPLQGPAELGVVVLHEVSIFTQEFLRQRFLRDFLLSLLSPLCRCPHLRHIPLTCCYNFDNIVALLQYVSVSFQIHDLIHKHCYLPVPVGGCVRVQGCPQLRASTGSHPVRADLRACQAPGGMLLIRLQSW